jgi:hypothetical protein
MRGYKIVKYTAFTKKKWFIFVAGLLLGALIILGIRIATYEPEKKIHYHANFAVYINGQREQFKNPTLYEETTMCTNENEEDESSDNPNERAHMHDNVNNVVHVEDSAVTWGQFFENLGWSLGTTTLVTDKGTVYREQGSDKLNIIINGQDYTDLGGITNHVIKDEDRLLLSYGDENIQTVMDQYKAIPSTARKYDTTPDPKSCSGQEGNIMRNRIRHMF